jgi:hypothetical protein
MKNEDIALRLKIPAKELSERCCRNDNMLLWCLREIAKKEGSWLKAKDKIILFDLMEYMVQFNQRGLGALSKMFYSGFIIIGNPVIHDLAKIYQENSPQFKKGVYNDCN